VAVLLDNFVAASLRIENEIKNKNMEVLFRLLVCIYNVSNTFVLRVSLLVLTGADLYTRIKRAWRNSRIRWSRSSTSSQGNSFSECSMNQLSWHVSFIYTAHFLIVLICSSFQDGADLTSKLTDLYQARPPFLAQIEFTRYHLQCSRRLFNLQYLLCIRMPPWQSNVDGDGFQCECESDSPGRMYQLQALDTNSSGGLSCNEFCLAVRKLVNAQDFEYQWSCNIGACSQTLTRILRHSLEESHHLSHSIGMHNSNSPQRILESIP
jgi:hypothetical protein